VVFGEVIRGKSVVRQIENYPTSSGDIPTSPITIVSAGVLSPDDPCLTASVKPVSGDVYEDFPDDEDQNVQDPSVALKIAREVRELGNKLFKEGKAEEALAKYQKSIRYLDVHPVMPDGSPPELKDSFNSLLTPLLLNSALAALKVHPQTSANVRISIECATRALDRVDLNNADKAKALYRRALAHVVLKEENSAESDLVAASQLVPEDQAITNELLKVRQLKKEKKEKEKKAFKKMFA